MAGKRTFAKEQVADLLYQALETELGGVQVYEAALRCALRDDLKDEWTKYLEQTQNHVRFMRDVLEAAGLNPAQETPGRKVVRHIGESLVAAIDMASQSAPQMQLRS
jgi:ferritin-like metal-binding protein YciE